VTQPKTIRRRATHRACALLLALTSAGCSLKFVRPPPPRSEWPNPVTADSSQAGCSDVIALPVADTLTAVGVGTIGYLERNSGSRSLALIFDVTTIPFLVSAVYGYVYTVQCHRYDKLFDQSQPLATPQTNAPPILAPAPPAAAGPPPHAP
jgi:hypothetical protein